MKTVNTDKAPKKAKRVKPIIVEEVSSEKYIVPAFLEKKVIKNRVPIPLAEGHIRVIVVRECEGMTGTYYVGDIIDLPERRFKSMRLRGLVEEYDGEKKPNRAR